MAYTVLARRYRSTTFDDVIGQDHVAQTLKKAIESGRIAHAYLFCGTRGVGKTSMARILAKALNCESFDKPTSTPCGKCNSCLGIARGDDLDVIEIDAASNRGIDNIRDLISNAQFRPARSRFKVYIIDEVHGLSKDAFNALLKVLEEPPSHVKFILATTEPEKVLPTILSRCQRYDFRNIGTREIAGHLKEICKSEKIEADEDSLLLVAKAGAGSMRDALSLLDRMLSAGEPKLTVALVEQLLGLPRSQLVFELAAGIGAGDVKSVLKRANGMIFGGQSVDSLIGTLVDHLRNLLIIRTCGIESDLVEAPGVPTEELDAQAKQFDPAALTQDIAILEEVRRQIRQSQAGRALLDAALVRLSLADQFSSIGELLSQARGGTPADPGEAQKKNDEPGAVKKGAGFGVQGSVDAAASIRKNAGVGVQGSANAHGVVSEDSTIRVQSAAVGDSAVAVSSSSLNPEPRTPNPSSPPNPEPQTLNPPSPLNPEPRTLNPPSPAHDLDAVWQSLLGVLSQQGMGIHSIIGHGKLVGVDAGLATIRYGVQHETFVKMLDRNGKKDIVREGLSRVLGQPMGVRFEVEVAEAIPSTTATETPAPENTPRIPERNPIRANGAAIASAVMPPALVASTSTGPARPMAEMIEELRQNEPVVRSLMDVLGATIVKIE